MNTVLRPLSAGVLGVAAVTAAIVALAGPIGWLLAVPAAAAGTAVLVRWVRARLDRPLRELAASVVPDARGTPVELAQAVASRHRELAGRLQAADTRLAVVGAATDLASEAIILLRPDGTIAYANPAAWTLKGRRLDPGTRLSSPELVRIVETAVNDAVPVEEEVTIRTPVARHLLARCGPLADGGAVLLMQDLADRHRLDRVRRDFVANVSHELKTPVAAVRALAEVAMSAFSDGDIDSAVRFVERIQSDAGRLGGLVVDLLDLSRVEAGGTLELQEVELRSIAQSAMEKVRPMADAKGIGLQTRGEAAVIEGDPGQLDMALRNLIENAVRYSDHGTVSVDISHQQEWARVAVTDQGVGIPADQLGRIFERFYRVDRARSRATGGTGLGLAIVRHVADNHGGRVEVSSEIGRGSTFTLYLPGAGPGSQGHAA